MKKTTFALGLMVIMVSGLAVWQKLPSYFWTKNKLTQQAEAQNNQGQPVIPKLFISGDKEHLSTGGLIALSSFEAPTVDLISFNLTGEASIDVYEADVDSLLDFLTHDTDGNQIKPKTDLSRLRLVTNFKQNILSNGTPQTVNLPIGESGIWFLNIRVGDNQDRAFVVRSKIASLVKEAGDDYVFWTQNLKSQKSSDQGKISLFNLKDKIKFLHSAEINREGLAVLPLTAVADIAVVESEDSLAIVPINLQHLNRNYYYDVFTEKNANTKYFVFTDRPVYKPGDKIYFKTILREDDDGVYTLPKGQYRAKVFKDWDERQSIYERTFTPTQGSFNGEIQLPETVKSGNYLLKIDRLVQPVQTEQDAGLGWVDSNYVNFQIENYRKPEYNLQIDSNTLEFVSGERAMVKITGDYFFGQPLAGQNVEYTIYSADYNDFEYYRDVEFGLNREYRYGYWYGNKILEGQTSLNGKGEVEIAIDTAQINFNGTAKIISVEAQIIDETQNPSFARKNLLFYPADFNIYRTDEYTYAEVNKNFNLPILAKARKNTDSNGIDIKAKIRRSSWITYQEPGKNYLSYREETEDLPEIFVKTDSVGKANINFIPKKQGSYNIVVTATDGAGKQVVKTFYIWATDSADPYFGYSTGYSGAGNDLTLRTEKNTYEAGDFATVWLTSGSGDKDVLLTVERDYVKRYQIITLKGKSASVSIGLLKNDLPNITLAASSFGHGRLETAFTEINLNTDSKKINLDLSVDKTSYGPGEPVRLNIQTNDNQGNPISAEVAVWAVDKAIYELADRQNPDIFSAFWQKRYNTTLTNDSLAGIFVQGGAEKGCFTGDTKILMADGSYKTINQVQVGEEILTLDQNKKLNKTKVSGTHNAEVAGYLIINQSLKVTPNHLLFVNGGFQAAGNIQPGDILIDKNGTELPVESIEWQAGKYKVYNLTIETYQTFIAENIWVHNEKGGGSSSRGVFKDTAYWNPKIQTGPDGRASLSFYLPDNLTTWVLEGLAANSQTQVGQKTQEILVTQDIIVRPVLPNIFRTGDKLKLSALVHNFTNLDQEFLIKLQSTDISIVGEVTQNVKIPAHEFQQIFWEAEPKLNTNEKAVMTFSATSLTDKKFQDTVTQTLPIRTFGYLEKISRVGTGETEMPIVIFPDSDRQKTEISISLASSLLGGLPTAMEYLIDYPYGCVEQTTSRFVPAVIAKANGQIFSKALKNKNLNGIINQGIKRLAELQQDQGGWQWWHEGNSDTFISAYVIEYLLQAKTLGFDIDQKIFDQAKAFLEENPYLQPNPPPLPIFTPLPAVINPYAEPTNNPREELVTRVYALTLLGSEKGKYEITDFVGLTPDLIAMAALSNFKNGFTESAKRAIALLKTTAKQETSTAHWDEGRGIYFGSKDASTAWVIRALINSNEPADIDLAAKGINYLLLNRQAEYWSNTFATAQVLRAVVEFNTKENSKNSNLRYQVLLDDQEIFSGQLNKISDNIKIDISPKKIKSQGSSLKILKQGEGQIYSLLKITQLRTDQNSAYISKGLQITRSIRNKNGRGEIHVGDVVQIDIHVKMDNQEENYAVIEDRLPSGLVPINRKLNNEEWSDPNLWRYANGDITENGSIFSVYYLPTGGSTYTYLARAVIEGEFLTPPATAELMYKSQNYGRSTIEKIKILKAQDYAVRDKVILAKIAKTEPGKKVLTQTEKALFISLLSVLVLAGLWSVYQIRKQNKAKTDQQPNAPEPKDNDNKNA